MPLRLSSVLILFVSSVVPVTLILSQASITESQLMRTG